MSKATKALGMDTALEAFKQVGDFFGIGKVVIDGLTTIADDLHQKALKWAMNTVTAWYEDAPWQTENLRDSLDYTADCPNYTVGVRLSDLLGPKTLPAKRTPSWGDITIPDYDYTYEANEIAVSGAGAGFIENAWKETARREARKEFR